MRLLLLLALALLAAKASGLFMNMLAAATIAGGDQAVADANWRCPRGDDCRFKLPADDPRGEKGGYSGVVKKNAPPGSKERDLGFFNGGSRAHAAAIEPRGHHHITHPPPCAPVSWPTLHVLLEPYHSRNEGGKECGCSCAARSCGKEEAQGEACEEVGGEGTGVH